MRFSRYYKRLKLRRLMISCLIMIISLFFMPSFVKYVRTGENIFAIKINGNQVGIVASVEKGEELLLKARKEVNALSQDTSLTLINADVTYEGQEVDFGRIDSDSVVITNIEQALLNAKNTSLAKAYEVKINSYVVDLKSEEEVLKLLQASVDKYDDTNSFVVSLINEGARELPVLTPIVSTNEELKENEEAESVSIRSAGFDLEMDTLYAQIEPDIEIPLEDYELGTTSIQFGDEIEIVEVYINPQDYTPIEEAIEEVTKEEEQSAVYKVVSGDTLSGIALTVGVPMDDLIAMNDSLEDERSLIRPDQELIYSVPEPKLAVIRQEVMYYEETYDAPIEYQYRDDWYTSDKEVLQQPSAGFRKAVATITFENDKKISTDIAAEDVIAEPVAKVVMKGTKVPPTYIKPINGGRMTSTFGPRKRPTKGASSYHKGIDWATPVGTPVYASCGGTVVKAGWGSGYGYCVYINHPDGRTTRYGHLSKVLVSAGQTVSQGQKIALSGNTGVSTGPHLHFEILIGGSQVNPLKYIGG